VWLEHAETEEGSCLSSRGRASPDWRTAESGEHRADLQVSGEVDWDAGAIGILEDDCQALDAIEGEPLCGEIPNSGECEIRGLFMLGVAGERPKSQSLLDSRVVHVQSRGQIRRHDAPRGEGHPDARNPISPR